MLNRILVADDDGVSRMVLAATLRKWGYQVVEVEDGQAAWQVLSGPDSPHLAILDWMMPGMDGVDVCRKVRDARTEDPLYIILLTARGEKNDIVVGLDAGADDYIAKPYDPDELQARLRVGRRIVDLETQLIAARDALAKQAYYDPLTDIYNRRAILDVLERELARLHETPHPLAVAIVDIDHFKAVNDRYGHLAGDEVLRQIVERLDGGLHAYDFWGRYGGEEFVIVAPLTRDRDAPGFFDQLRQRVDASACKIDHDEVHVTISIGVTVLESSCPLSVALHQADMALYSAKATGRNRVVIYCG